MLTCLLFFCFNCGVVYLKVQLSLVPGLNWVLGFSGSGVSVSVIMSGHLAARCIENNYSNNSISSRTLCLVFPAH